MHDNFVEGFRDMDAKQVQLFSWDIDENDPAICFSIKVSVADLDFWLKLVGPAAAMVKKGPWKTKFHVCPDADRLFGNFT